MKKAASLLLVSSSPAQVAELAPADEASKQLLKSAVEACATALIRHEPQRVLVVGEKSGATYTSRTGSFAAWGAPSVEVGYGNYLAELLVRYILRLSVHPMRPSREIGIEFNDTMRVEPGSLTVVCADGPAGLSERAPLSLLPRAAERHRWCEELLRTGKRPNGYSGDHPSHEDLLAAGIVHPTPWLELLTIHAGSTKLYASQTAHGVGRYVALWEDIS